MAKVFNKKVIWFFITAFLLRLFLSFYYYHGDINNHIAWVNFAKDFGLRGFYESFNLSYFSYPNYPPLAIFSFLSADFLYEKIFSFLWWININLPLFPSFLIPWFKENGLQAFMKLPGIFADIGLGALIYYFLKKQKNRFALWGSLLFLFNPAVFYLSGLWGQIESLVMFFVFLSLFLLFEKKIIFGVLAFVLSLMVKPSSLIFAPVILILFLKNKPNFNLYLKSLVSVLFLILLFSLPFFVKEPFSWFFRFYANIISGPKEMFYLSANAFNFWALLFGMGQISDKIFFKGVLDYRTWGILLSLPLFLVVLIKLWQNRKIDKIFQACLLITLIIFLFMTRMHERYLFPVIPFLAVLTIINSKKFKWAYIFFSLSFLCNLYHNWWIPSSKFFVRLISNDVFIKSLITLDFLFFFYLIFDFLKMDWSLLGRFKSLMRHFFRKK